MWCKIIGWGLGSNHHLFDWMEANLKANLRSIVRKGQGLSRLNNCRSLANIAREKSVVSLEDWVIIFWLKITRSTFSWNICMDESFTIRSIICIYKTGWISFHANFNEMALILASTNFLDIFYNDLHCMKTSCTSVCFDSRMLISKILETKIVKLQKLWI